jgi:hypothetical protein
MTRMIRRIVPIDIRMPRKLACFTTPTLSLIGSSASPGYGCSAGLVSTGTALRLLTRVSCSMLAFARRPFFSGVRYDGFEMLRGGLSSSLIFLPDR